MAEVRAQKVVMYDLEGNVVLRRQRLITADATPDADTAEHPDDDL